MYFYLLYGRWLNNTVRNLFTILIYTEPFFYYFRQYGAGTEVPIKSLLGHRSQAPPEVRIVQNWKYPVFMWLQYYSIFFFLLIVIELNMKGLRVKTGYPNPIPPAIICLMHHLITLTLQFWLWQQYQWYIVNYVSL